MEDSVSDELSSCDESDSVASLESASDALGDVPDEEKREGEWTAAAAAAARLGRLLVSAVDGSAAAAAAARLGLLDMVSAVV